MATALGRLIPVTLAAAAVIALLVVVVRRARHDERVRERYRRRREPGPALCEVYSATPSADSLVSLLCGAGEGRVAGPARVTLRHADIARRGIRTELVQAAAAECGGVVRRHLFWCDTVAVSRFSCLASCPREAVLRASREAFELLDPEDRDYVMVSCEGLGSVVANAAGMELPDARCGVGEKIERATRGEGRRGEVERWVFCFVAIAVSPLPSFMARERDRPPDTSPREIARSKGAGADTVTR